MSNKVKVPGGAFYAGDGLTVDPVTRTVSAGGGGGGSVPKPLTYDYMPEGYPKKDGWSIEWDGNPEGKIAVAADGMQFYKISDMVPSYDDLLGAMVTSPDYPGATATITSEDIDVESDDIINIFGFIIMVVVRKDNADAGGITFPEKGVYASDDKFKMSKETITPMSTDFIPMVSETEPGLSIPLDNLYSDVLKQVHDEYFAESDIQSPTYANAQAIQEFAFKNNSYGVFQPGKFSGKVLSAYNNTIDKYLTVVLAGSNKVECRKFTSGSTNIEQLWSIQKDGVIISSSTPDSTKKFKITVDDSGTIKATEVTA